MLFLYKLFLKIFKPIKNNRIKKSIFLDFLIDEDII